MRDKNNQIRTSCQSCDCLEFRFDGQNNCAYCNCLSTRHILISEVPHQPDIQEYQTDWLVIMGMESLTFKFLKKQISLGTLVLIVLVFAKDYTNGPFSKKLFTLYISFGLLIRRDAGFNNSLYRVLEGANQIHQILKKGHGDFFGNIICIFVGILFN